MKKVLALLSVLMLSLFLVGCSQEKVDLVDEQGNVVGEAFKYSPTKYTVQKTALPVASKYKELADLEISFCLDKYTPKPFSCVPVDNGPNPYLGKVSYICEQPDMPKDTNFASLCPKDSAVFTLGLYVYGCFANVKLNEKSCLPGYNLNDLGPNYFVCEKEGYVAPTGSEAGICGTTGGTFSKSLIGSYCCVLS
jgi:hypothetical protein